jgi:hypothetical protein
MSSVGDSGSSISTLQAALAGTTSDVAFQIIGVASGLNDTQVTSRPTQIDGLPQRDMMQQTRLQSDLEAPWAQPNPQKADWDIRLAKRQTALQARFTAMETALANLQSQVNWLSGRIAELVSPH